MTSLPLYRHALDWDKFYDRFPVPDVFVNTIYKWSPDRILALQNNRFLEIMQVGWRNPFYQRLWKTAALSPET
jgi:hypothetical protein